MRYVKYTYTTANANGSTVTQEQIDEALRMVAESFKARMDAQFQTGASTYDTPYVKSVKPIVIFPTVTEEEKKAAWEWKLYVAKMPQTEFVEVQP